MATRECFVREKAVRVQGKVLAVYFDFCFVFSVVFSLKYLRSGFLFVERESTVVKRVIYCCGFYEVMEWSRDNVLLEKRLCEHREKCGCVILIFVFFSALCFR